MRVRIKPSKPEGCIGARPSKSSMQRAVAAGLLTESTSVITNACFSDDSQSAIRMAECLGASIEIDGGIVRITGGLNPRCKELDCGESGLGVRLFSAIAALSSKDLTFTGRGSILKRPMSMIEESLMKLGVRAGSEGGFLPLHLRGPLKGGKIDLDGSVTSQFLTGLLFALPLAENNSVIRVDSLRSKPYIDLSLGVLDDFGISIENREYTEFIIEGQQSYRPVQYRVEEDWSGVAFLAVLGALAGRIRINDLSDKSVQADRAILDVLKMSGASVDFRDNRLEISESSLKGFDFDISDCPDLAPPLAALAALSKGKSIMRGTDRLVSKESNRSEALLTEFAKLGIKVEISNDRMEIKGSGKVLPGEVDSHGDHRIAMALAVCAAVARGPVIINGAEAVSKSYPAFFDDLSSLGISVEYI